MKLLTGQETTVNYIKKLKLELEAAQAKQAAAVVEISRMRAFLASSKFTGVESDGSRKDWISTGDVDTFLRDLTSELLVMVDVEEISASKIAEALTSNGQAYHVGDISHDDYAAQNVALWQQAEAAGVNRQVMNILNAAR